MDAAPRDAGVESDARSGDDAGGPDAGLPRWLPECPLQPGQTRLTGARSPEGLLVTLPGRLHSTAAGGDVAALLHQDPWQVSEVRADRTALLHAAFEEPATEAAPFRTDVSMSVSGDGTIWLTRTDWESLDDHGRSLRAIGRQVVSIYCGVRTVHTALDESDLVRGTVTLGESGVPIAAPDGATLMVMPDGALQRTFLGETERLLGEGESLGGQWVFGGRLFLRVDRGERSYLVEYDGEPVTAADSLLDAVEVLSQGTPFLDAPLVYCGEADGRSTLLAPRADGADERVALETGCPDWVALLDGQRWAAILAPRPDAGFYRWDPGEAPALRAPLDEALSDLRFVPHSQGGFIVYYASGDIPRYRVRYIDLTQSNELGTMDLYGPVIHSDADHAYFVEGRTVTWLTETERFDQVLDGVGVTSVGERDPEGGLWLTVRMFHGGTSPNRSRLVRLRPRQTPEVILEAIENAWFGWHEGFGYGEVWAFDERVDLLGTHFVERTSTPTRVGGALSVSANMLSEARSLVSAERWILYDGTLRRLRGGAAPSELEGITEILATANDAAGRTWFTSDRPGSASFYPRRVARVTDDGVEVAMDLTGEAEARFFDAGIERDFARQPWGIRVQQRASVLDLFQQRLCPFTNPSACIALPDGAYAAVITAEGLLFAWRTGIEETTLWSRDLR